MAIISKIFPVVFAFITWGLPSGVGLYFATSNLWQIGQQEVVYRTMMNPSSAPPPKKGEGEIEGSTGKGGGGKGGGGAATATKSTGSKTGGTKPGASAARAASRGSGSKPAAKPPTKPDAKAGGGGDAKGSANGSKNGNGQARPAGGARSNRKRKR
jgi:hypothetical protein